MILIDIVDDMIDAAIAVLVMALIIFLIKVFGFAGTSGWRFAKGKINDKRYPIKSQEFPEKAMSLKDKLTLLDAGEVEYQGKMDGKHCLAYPDGMRVNGESYILLDSDELAVKVQELRNKDVVKWVKEI